MIHLTLRDLCTLRQQSSAKMAPHPLPPAASGRSRSSDPTPRRQPKVEGSTCSSRTTPSPRAAGVAGVEQAGERRGKGYPLSKYGGCQIVSADSL